MEGGATVAGKSTANAQETLEASKDTAINNGLSTAYPLDLQIRRPFYGTSRFISGFNCKKI
ncbi:hypothetical protein WJF07_001408 [Klebsiella pneumoniae]